MPKRAKKTPSTCEQHLFILKPKQSFCRFGQTATVSFCDSGMEKSKGKGKKGRNCQRLDCPTFNNDGNFATPTFILGSQKQYYEERGVKMRQQHERKMVEYTDEKDSLNVPKPRTKNNFCSVCREVYEDYLDHIESEKHKKKINSSVFNKYILDVAEKFNPVQKNNCSFSYQTLSTRDEDDLEVLEHRPMKKVKSNYEPQERGTFVSEMMRSQVLPPPHLNLSNSAYFPGLGSNMSYFSQPVNYGSIPMPQMTFNYNMNFFWNPYYNPSSYMMMNPYNMECLPPVNSMPKLDQNSFMSTKYLSQKNLPEVQWMGRKSEEKRELNMGQQKQSIIVIDDEEDEMERMMHKNRV